VRRMHWQSYGVENTLGLCGTRANVFNVTRDAELVTCKRCVTVLSEDVEHAITKRVRHHVGAPFDKPQSHTLCGVLVEDDTRRTVDPRLVNCDACLEAYAAKR